jgi:hypothetical protein
MAQILKLRPHDWTADEKSQIERVRDLFCDPRWDVECSHTDEGDPWCIVYDQERGAIVLHVARINRRYVVVWPGYGSENFMTMEAAIKRIARGRL